MQSMLSSRVRSAFLGANVPFSSRVGLVKPCIAPARQSGLHVVAAYGDLPKISPGRKWKHLELNKNGKPVRIKMHIKKGDTVKVITGADRGKVSTILSVDTKTGKVLVEGVNIKTKHVKPRGTGETGSIKKFESPVQHSNVQLYSKAQGVVSRVGHKMTEEGKKVRYLIKTGETLD